MPLLRIEELRAFEKQFSNVEPGLMERAGAAATQVALHLLPRPASPVLVLAGPGNNGGDAFVVARLLHRAGHVVTLVFLGDTERLPADAAAAHHAVLSAGLAMHAEVPPGVYALAIDGLFGIGLTRPLDGRYAKLIEQINAFGGPVLALDIPSGLDAATGRCHGRAVVRASHTATFIAGKPGLYTADGPDHCGEITTHSLGLEVNAVDGEILATTHFASGLKARPRNSHKGSNGSLAIIGGAPGMAGAALLAARASLKLGAGRVFVGMLERLAIDFCQPELMLRDPVAALDQADAVVIGPGLGQSAAALELLRRTASVYSPILLDADALNLLSEHPVIAAQLRRRESPALLTPHPTEAARLLHTTTEIVQADRISAALELASRFKALVALKGCGTILAHPDGTWLINTTGNPGLASGGTGDVLAGMAGALLAQAWPEWPALCAAVHLHGQAADDCVAVGHGPVGLTASELADAARLRLNRWIVECNSLDVAR